MLIRAISAIIGLSFIAAVIHFSGIHGLVALFALVAFISTIEFSIMVEKENKIIRSLFITLAYAFYLSFTFLSQSFLVFLGCFIVLASYFILFSKYDNETKGVRLNSWIMGFIYCGALTGTATHGLIEFGFPYFYGLFILSFATDTFAYFGGRLFGKHLLAPDISPKKTIEGAALGLIFGAGGGFLYLSQIPHTSSNFYLIICCLLSSLFSMVGDLFESLIKRNSGVKDSGKMMPGHGGLLDRIDGLLFVAPALYLWMQFFI